MREVIYIGVHHDYAELDELMTRFQVRSCVIDAMPEIHATRGFSTRHRGRVWLNFFQESQRGSYQWDREQRIVRENRTEAMDASRKIIRDEKVVLPRVCKVVEEFAEHVANDAKRLEEDPDSVAQVYRYKKLGVNHFSLAFTYDCVAWSRDGVDSGRVIAGGPVNHALGLGPF